MDKQYSIVLVDDHVIVRSGLKELIEHIGNFKVTASFDNGLQLVNNIYDIEPDIIIMDLSMPVMDGQETIKWLKDHKIHFPVLMLTLNTNENAIAELFRYGVRGYLSKTCTADELKRAITDILHTGYYNNDMMAHAMKNIGAARKIEEEHKELLEQFTDKELEFLHLVCDKEEYTYERISEFMGVHRRTVDNYRESLFKKFNIKSKTGLVLLAIKYGIISVE